MTAEFMRHLDRAIPSGLPSAGVARLIEIYETTVRRRKAQLANEGRNFNPNAQRTKREGFDVDHRA